MTQPHLTRREFVTSATVASVATLCAGHSTAADAPKRTRVEFAREEDLDFIGGWGGVPDWYMRQVTDALKQSATEAVQSERPAVLEDGEVYALSAVCTHAGGSLDQGTLDEQGRITCPRHGSMFQCRDGAVWRGFLGIMLLAIIGNGFNLLNINTTYQQIVYGGLILIAVAADQLLRRRA